MAQGKLVKTGLISYNHTTSYPGKNLILPPSEICLQEEVSTPTPLATSDKLPTVAVMKKNLEEAVEPPKDNEGRETDAPPADAPFSSSRRLTVDPGKTDRILQVFFFFFLIFT